MIRRGEVPALVRRGASLVAALALSASSALAGDRALIDFIGFSPDAKYFAFEQFGIQDGSGFAFSEIFVIDLAADKWVPGTPVTVRIEDEEVGLGAARKQSAEGAADVLEKFGITEPVEILALNGDGAAEADFTKLRFGVPGYGLSEPASDQTLRLESFTAKSPLPCRDWFSEAPLGLALILEEGDGERVIHRDKRLPESRGCVFEYRLHSVVQPGWAQDISAAVAIVSVYSGGFEGPDRRFIAVPIGQ
ncbi:DUF2259 domain-containing protein [Devosia sp. SD17-2]|jgi:predicted secreted protein|uniref:DUF2259 domain-containing protein n=1 Tax=Devosia sp. SD17-2 TaxID=2976459 RepID=UPI0023D87B96|nr:DUF2259 domain-containing protein [Devosia sp. SD17-2]WEJ33243.1 DUF2259 domain-containing protein [Devosia sp. SD17-2]